MLKKIIALIIALSLNNSVSYSAIESAESCVLISADSRQILYDKDAFEKMGMASTTKIMTAIVALENADMNKIITVSENAQNQEGSSIYLRAGDKLPLLDLLYGLMLNSGNDAAVAIAEGVCGNIENFVDVMNEKAKEIGCKKTHFINPNGLSDSEHFTTAYDLALIMAYAMENEMFAKIVSTKEYQIKNENTVTYLKNHNKLLWQTIECIGGKTGFTKADGRCLVSCAEKDGKRIIAVTLNDRDDWKDHQSLYDLGFDKMEKVKVIEENEILSTQTIRGTKVNILSGESMELYLKNGKKSDVCCKIFLHEKVNDEIVSGSEIGYAEISVNDYKMGTMKVLSGQDVKEDYFSKLKNNIKYFLDFVLLKKGT